MSDELFGSLMATGPVAELIGDRAWLQAMLDFEAALAGAQADVGLLPAEEAAQIAAACRAELFDPAAIGARAGSIGNPAGPLVRELTARVAGPAAGSVHQGATSQDVMDTAAMLVAARASAALLAELRGCGDSLRQLARTYRDTPQVGRTLGQHALPSTFGYTVAGWLSGIRTAEQRLRALRPRLAVQLGGAVGTLAVFGARGAEVLTAIAARLGLAEPLLPWHTERGRIAELAGALGQLCGAVDKIAGDVLLLAQTELAEVAEHGPAGSGGSSTMPHKRNPVAAVAARASARQAPGLVATLLAAMAQEHQRGMGSWHAEWQPLTELLRASGSAAYWLRESLARLRVDPGRMRENLASTDGLLLAERVSTELTPALGRLTAHDAVTGCAVPDGRSSFAARLAADPVIGAQLDAERIAELLDPAGYLGSAKEFVDRVLEETRRDDG
ncbi:3-carboxy-cis,cis-muconate cycloisomerase [Tamaricihabitans halophyticus]|nr:3-carboxy-cis,cis-muconate cycloisomerase [Tamaricihabitans halophyticus]